MLSYLYLFYNVRGCSPYDARKEIIEQQFGYFSSETIMQYYYSVQKMGDTTPIGEMLDRALQKDGMTGCSPSVLSDYFEKYKERPEKVAIEVEGHVGVIDKMDCTLTPTEKIYNIKIKDNYPSGENRPKDKKEHYHIIVDRETGKYKGSDLKYVWF